VQVHPQNHHPPILGVGRFLAFIRAGLSVNELNSLAGAPFYNGLPHSSAFFLPKGWARAVKSTFVHMLKPAGSPGACAKLCRISPLPCWECSTWNTSAICRYVPRGTFLHFPSLTTHSRPRRRSRRRRSLRRC